MNDQHYSLILHFKPKYFHQYSKCPLHSPGLKNCSQNILFWNYHLYNSFDRFIFVVGYALFRLQLNYYLRAKFPKQRLFPSHNLIDRPTALSLQLQYLRLEYFLYSFNASDSLLYSTYIIGSDLIDNAPDALSLSSRVRRYSRVAPPESFNSIRNCKK